MATRSEPSESFAMPNGKSRPLANVVMRKSFGLTPGPWTVNGCAKAVPRQTNAAKIITAERIMCPKDTNELDFAIMIIQPSSVASREALPEQQRPCQEARDYQFWGRAWSVSQPPSWKPPAPSPRGGRAGRGLGRGAPSIELARLIGIPSPLPSPHSSVVGRGNRPEAGWWCHRWCAAQKAIDKALAHADCQSAIQPIDNRRYRVAQTGSLLYRRLLTDYGCATTGGTGGRARISRIDSRRFASRRCIL